MERKQSGARGPAERRGYICITPRKQRGCEVKQTSLFLELMGEMSNVAMPFFLLSCLEPQPKGECRSALSYSEQRAQVALQGLPDEAQTSGRPVLIYEGATNFPNIIH